MANNIDINKSIGDVVKLNEELKKTAAIIGEILTNQSKLSTELSKAKTHTEAASKNTKIKQQQNQIEIEGNKLLNQRNAAIAKQSQLLQPLTKETIKQQEALKEQNRLLREQAKEELGIKRRNGLFKSMTKSIIAASTALLSFRAAFRVLANSLKTIASFEEAMSKVKAVAGALPKDFKQLQTDAKRLGSITSKTSSEVAGLQLEFAKLGFSTEEILNATEATIQLSVAAGSDLAESAVVAASTVRGFGLNAAETQKVVDVMAKSFSSSALDLEKFKIAMAIAAPVAKSAGKDIEFTTAKLSVLADAGLDASTAGTSLRNMFLELAQKGLTWEQGLAKINNSTNKNVTALDLFGKRGATAAIILADNIDKATKLEESYDKASGAAAEMARIMEDNLIGDTKRLSSAWEGFILGLNKGEGSISKVFRNITQNITALINKLTELNLTAEEKLSARQIMLATDTYNSYVLSINEAISKINDSAEAEAKRSELIQQDIEHLNKLIEENIKLSEELAGEDIKASDFYEEEAKIYQIVVEKLKSLIIEKENENNVNAESLQVLDELNSKEIDYINEKIRLKKVIEEAKIAINSENISNAEKIALTDTLIRSENELFELEKNRIKELISQEKDNLKIAELKSKLSDIEIQQLKEVIILEKKRKDLVLGEGLEDLRIRTLEDSFDREKQIENQRNKLFEEATAKNREQLNKRYEDNKKYLDALKDSEIQAQAQRQELLYSKIQEGGNAIFDLNQSQRQLELESLNAYYQAQIAANEGNKAKQAELAEQLRIKQVEIARQQAKSERNQAIFNIGITTTQEALKIKAQALTYSSNPVTLPLAANALAQLGLLLGTSAASVAALLAQPLPGFFKGTENAPKGLAWVAEKGRELIETSKGLFIVDKPMIYDFKGGEKVKTNFETEKIINSTIMKDVAINGNEGIEKRLDALLHKHNPAPKINIDKNGLVVWHSSNNNIKKYLNTKVRK